MDVNEVAFPNNVVLALKQDFESHFPPDPGAGDPGIPVFARPLNSKDPAQCIGISAGMWLPDEESYELGGNLLHTGATVNNYIIGIQGFVKHMSEDTGLAISATLAGAIRNRIMLSAENRAALAGLSSSVFGYTESFSRAVIQSQRFISNEIQGQFLYLNNMELRIETQINPM